MSNEEALWMMGILMIAALLIEIFIRIIEGNVRRYDEDFNAGYRHGVQQIRSSGIEHAYAHSRVMDQDEAFTDGFVQAVLDYRAVDSAPVNTVRAGSLWQEGV